MRFGWMILFGLLSLSDCSPKRVQVYGPPSHALTEVDGRYFYEGANAWIIVTRNQDIQKAQQEVCGKGYICIEKYRGTLIVVQRVQK